MVHTSKVFQNKAEKCLEEEYLWPLRSKCCTTLGKKSHRRRPAAVLLAFSKCHGSQKTPIICHLMILSTQDRH